ncbi:MAG TPA: TonB-dependent receptor [Bryobacteraceae bacterium]|nr:TonB-dependent receptor [Bryobacteraceae bacterium]
MARSEMQSTYIQGFNLRREAAVRCLRPALLLFVLLGPLAAQTSNGTIRGRVTDSSGAIIPAATVELTSIERGTVSSSVTNEAGLYLFPTVQPGDYRLTVQKEGFKQSQLDKVTVDVGANLQENFTLALGSVKESVTVASEASQVDTVSSTVSTVVTGAPIEDLPLNGRDTLQLALTAPGVTPSIVALNSGNTAAGVPGGEFTIAGGRDNAITYLLNGGDNTSVTYGVPVVDPNPDTVAEFRIIENNYSAEYGRSNGGVVSVVTKSGTNALHGTAFDYLRNTDFNANNFFNQDTPGAYQARPILRRNQFGGTIGGPITLPKIVKGKDRFFFFFGYQGQRQNSIQVNPQVTTYTPAELAGNFSQAPGGAPASLVGFLQTHPYFQPNPQLAAEGIIAPSSISPVTQGYITNNLIPTSPTGTLTPNGPALDNRDEFTIKTDFNITAADRLAITLVRFHNPFDYPFVQSGAPNVPGFPGDDTFDNYFGNVGYTKVISPTIVNEFHLTAQRDYNSLNNPAIKLPTSNALGIQNTPDDATGPAMMLLNASNLQLGFNINGPAYYADTTYAYEDSVSWIRGKHSFKAGASLAYVQNNAFFAFASNGAFSFDGPAGIGSGVDLADFLMGIPDYYYQYPGAFSAVRSHQVAAYLQDEWKVKSNFTLTLGLRYEYQSPKRDPFNRNYMIIPGDQSVKYPNAPLGLVFPGDPGTPPSGVNFPNRTDFAPRVGFAWDPFGKGKTSIRGGFGVFYDTILAQDNQNQNGTPPFYSAAFVPFDPSEIPANGPATFLSDPFGTGGVINPFPSKPISKDINFVNAGFIPFGPSSVFINPHMRTPYTLQYNFSIQQQVANGMTAEIGYVGSESRKLIAQEDIDPFLIGTTTRVLNTQPGLQIPDAYGQMPYTFGNLANANYNALVMSLTQRTGELRGIGQIFFTASYTWAHNLDDADGFARNSNDVSYYNQNAFYASADTDIRNRFVLSAGWQLPFNKAWSSGPKRLTQGWILDPIFTWQSGLPVDITGGLFQDGVTPGPSGDGDQNLVRPDWSGGPVQTYNPHGQETLMVDGTPITGHFFFNPSGLYLPACFSSSAPPGTPGGCAAATYGTLGRNAFRGPGLVNLDLALEKRTYLTERVQLNFRAEFFNALNHTEFQPPLASTPIDSPLMGQITATYNPRIGQLALRLVF